MGRVGAVCGVLAFGCALAARGLRLVSRQVFVLGLCAALALGGAELFLLYQPILDLKTNKVCAFEALARLRTEKLGLVPPIEFIPIAEKTKLIIPDGEIITTTGCCQGLIAPEERGSRGFGYDPVFYIPEYNATMAELSADIKNQISHRARALAAMIPHIQEKLISR